jgi:hypothetical protein
MTVLVTKQAVALMDVDIDHGMHYGAAHVRPAAMAPNQGELGLAGSDSGAAQSPRDPS